MSNDNIPPELRTMLRRYDQRLKELERRLTGLGTNPIPSGLASAELFFSDESDPTVASGAFPAIGGTAETFTPTRDIAYGLGLLQVIAQPPSGANGTFDYGCNIGIDTGGGFGFQWICSLGERIYTSPTPNSSFMRTVVGLEIGMTAGEPIGFQHEYYYPDIGGLGGTAAFFSTFILIAFAALDG